MKNIFYIVCAGLLIGGTAIAIYLSNSKKKESSGNSERKGSEDRRKHEEELALTQSATTREEPAFENIKASAVGSIYSRHKNAAAAMRASADVIHENVKASEDTSNEIDELSTKLGKMLKGE